MGATIGTALLLWSRIAAGEALAVPTDMRQLATLVAELVIPRSDTPGAMDVKVPDFLILALDHGLDGTRQPAASVAINGADARYRRQDGSLDHLAWLGSALDAEARGSFLTATPATRLAALTAVDTAAFAPGAPLSPWKTIKGLILTGYYTSEAGASKELQYELVPGRFDPDLPLKPGNRAWSSDWTAVDFG